MAMSKAFPSVFLPADFKRQACGHTFRATQPVTVCADCRAVIGRKGPAAQPNREVLVYKAAKALHEVTAGALTMSRARELVGLIVDHDDARPAPIPSTTAYPAANDAQQEQAHG
jgi:hypothetical protein